MDTQEITELLSLPELLIHLNLIENQLFDVVRSENRFLGEPSLRVVQGGGKRIRPILTIASALIAKQAGNSNLDDLVIAGAAAVELAHTALLVHDDIIDNAAERRGTPTVNSKEGIHHAVLVGDYLLARSGEQAARINKEAADMLAAAIVQACDGQTREIVDSYNVQRTVESCLLAMYGKTAALIRASCCIGALCADATADEVDALAGFGESFGLAFQIIDDALDLVSTAESLGKPVGNDLHQGTYTLPVLFLLQEGGEAAQRMCQLLRQGIKPAEVAEAVDIIRQSGTVSRSLDLARGYNRKATEALAVFGENLVVEGMKSLPSHYLDWATQRMVGSY